MLCMFDLFAVTSNQTVLIRNLIKTKILKTPPSIISEKKKKIKITIQKKYSVQFQ